MNGYQIKNEKEIDYNTLRLIQKHSQLYFSSNDKKEFLKNVCAYEQKLILLQSQNPCEVLMFLAEIDTISTNMVIEELTNEEIIDLLEKFSAEDKKSFYSRFPNLAIVNRFILKDENSSEHVKDLSFERKSELLDTTKEETMPSATTIYQSLTTEEKQEVVTNSNLSDDVVSKISESAGGDLGGDTQTEETSKEAPEAPLPPLPPPPPPKLDINTLPENDQEVSEEENKETKTEEKEEEKEEKPEELEPPLPPKTLEPLDSKATKDSPVASAAPAASEPSGETKSEEPTPVEAPAVPSTPEVPVDAQAESEIPEASITPTVPDVEIEPNQESQAKGEENLLNTLVDEKSIEFYEKYSIIGNGESQASIIMHSELVDKFDYESKKEEKKEIDSIKNLAEALAEEGSKAI